MKSEKNDIMRSLSSMFELTGEKLTIKDPVLLKRNMDHLVYCLIFDEDEEKRSALRWIVREAAIRSGAVPSSIQSFYEAKSKGQYGGMTVPAINIRGLTYDTARAVFRCAKRLRSKSFIFEIAKSEIAYTKQKPQEYSTVILAAALKEDYRGPVFIQGDHFQVNAKKFALNKNEELKELKELIKEALAADFYNIDIDASTTVDLTKKTVDEQQFNNYESTSLLADFIRENEPEGITVSTGGEIGEVGGKNSTVLELESFINGFNRHFGKDKNRKGLSKISVQTGTSHGGVVLPDGSIAKVKLDFETLRELSKAAKRLGLSGAVQHGASTLPEEAFDKFPETDTAEIHLATGFQNIIYDSPNLPVALKNRIIEYIHDNFISEKKEGETDEQFVYKTRKKAFGPFKKEIYDMPEKNKEEIGKELESRFELLFKKLNAVNTERYIDESVEIVSVPKPAPGKVSKLLK